MKKYLYLILLSSMCVMLSACANENDTQKNSEQSNASQQEEQESENSDNFSEILKSEIAQPYDVPKVLIYYSDDTSKTDLLGMGKNKKWTLLANCFDKTLLRNQTVFDVSKQLGVPFTPDYRVVDVYTNDTLQGSYLLVDTIEVSPTRVDIDTSKNEFLLELDYNPQDEESRYFYSPTYEIKFAINEPEIKDLTNEQYTYLKEIITNESK